MFTHFHDGEPVVYTGSCPVCDAMADEAAVHGEPAPGLPIDHARVAKLDG